MSHLSSARLRLAAAVTVAALGGGLAGHAFQGHMFSALRALQSARAQLALAAPDKAGYRVRAISLVDQAIAATQSGIHNGAE